MAKKVASLTSGDYLGENALLRNEPRNATIQAETPLFCLKMSRDKFQELGLTSKLQFANRRAVGGGGARQLVTKSPDKKTSEERQLMVDAMKANKNLQTMVTLDDANCNALCDIAWKQKVPEGDEIIQQGNLDADYFYIVQEGSFEVLLLKQTGSGQEMKEKVGVVPKGGSFGELALLYFAARAATVKAQENSVVWVMDRQNFKKILTAKGDAQTGAYVQYLDKVDIFSALKDDEKLTIAKALQDMKFQKGESILTEGEMGSSFYILIEGEVEVIVKGKQVSKLKGTTSKAEIFGERAILNNEPRAATIKVLSESCKTLCMDKKSFEMLLGPLEALKQRGKDGSTRVAKVKNASAPARADGKQHILRKHLNKLGLLGCGGFGAVVSRRARENQGYLCNEGVK
jgi:cAMP-dependent protein kinase regulator